MDSKAFRHLLGRLLLVPVAALAGLALLLGVALQQVTRSAHWVDHSDQVMAAAHELSNLMVDQETGLRGYVATGDRTFLQPFEQADLQIPAQFSGLLRLVADNPEQTAAVQHLQADYTQWRSSQLPLLSSASSSSQPVQAALAEQKRRMDSLRDEWAGFFVREQSLRVQRSAWSSRIDRFTAIAMVALLILVAVLITQATRGTFKQLGELYGARVATVEASRVELHAREQWLQTTLRSIGDAVIACDVQGRVVFMNRIAEMLTGWNEPEARGEALATVFKIVNETTRAVVESPVDKVRRLGAIVGLANHTVLLRRDGSEVAIDDSGAPIRDAEGNMTGIVLVFRDIGEKRKSEQALLRAEKLASAGRLSASIAHEVNNPLEALVNLLFLARGTDDTTDSRRLIAQAETEVGRISHITRQSLGFFKDATALADFDPAEVVEQVVDFYRSRAQVHGVTLETNIAGEVRCHGSAGELQQVISNLLANSLDACGTGHRIRVTVRPATTDGTAAARITIADTGCGISADKLPRIFDAFYTTKETTGTGLGLWVTRQLIEKHGGTLRVRSRTAQPGSGTVVAITLPCVSTLAAA